MIADFGRNKAHIAIISARRPHAVPALASVLGDFARSATWYVPGEELEAYTEAGAEQVWQADGLCFARNMALSDAKEQSVACLQLSDDLKKIEQPVYDANRSKYVAAPLSFEEAVCRMFDALAATGAHLAGVAPTANPFYYGGKTIHPKAFIVGDMMLINGEGPCFDEELKLKEDYDFTLAHLNRFGVVARCNDVLATFQHRTNKGGAVAYRTPELEQASIAHLKAKWGRAIKDNPRRPNEILLNIK